MGVEKGRIWWTLSCPHSVSVAWRRSWENPGCCSRRVAKIWDLWPLRICWGLWTCSVLTPSKSLRFVDRFSRRTRMRAWCQIYPIWWGRSMIKKRRDLMGSNWLEVIWILVRSRKMSDSEAAGDSPVSYSENVNVKTLRICEIWKL